ncbi:MAG: HEAT repeat domain-containing protein [Elusimicrobiota bacterium]
MRKLCVLIIFIVLPLNFLLSKTKKDKTNEKVSTQTVKTEISIAKKALEVIVLNLKNSDSDIKAYAIEALSRTNNSRLIPIIQKYLNDTSKYVIISTVKSLWNLGDIKSITKIYDIISEVPASDNSKNDPLTQLKIISQNKIREKAIETLVDLYGIKANKILIELKNNDNYSQIRDAASRELAKIGYKNELENFYTALNSSDEEIRNQAAENLIRICPTESNKIISAIKKEKSIRVKILLLESLKCAVLSKKDEEEILKYTNDDNQTIRYKSIKALLNSQNPKIIEELKKIYTDTPDIITKLTILKKLLQNQKIEVTESDVAYFNSLDNSEVKRKFIEIAEYIPSLSGKYLLSYLEDKDPYVQIDAAVKIIEMEKKND